GLPLVSTRYRRLARPGDITECLLCGFVYRWHRGCIGRSIHGSRLLLCDPTSASTHCPACLPVAAYRSGSRKRPRAGFCGGNCRSCGSVDYPAATNHKRLRSTEFRFEGFRPKREAAIARGGRSVPQRSNGSVESVGYAIAESACSRKAAPCQVNLQTQPARSLVRRLCDSSNLLLAPTRSSLLSRRRPAIGLCLCAFSNRYLRGFRLGRRLFSMLDACGLRHIETKDIG